MDATGGVTTPDTKPATRGARRGRRRSSLAQHLDMARLSVFRPSPKAGQAQAVSLQAERSPSPKQGKTAGLKSLADLGNTESLQGRAIATGDKLLDRNASFRLGASHGVTADEDAGHPHVVAMLQREGNVRPVSSLNLSGNTVGEMATVELGQWLRVAAALSDLQLAQCQISDRDGSLLVNAAEVCRRCGQS